MAEAPVYLKSLLPVFRGDGTATATGELRDGVPEILHGVREFGTGSIFAASAAEATRLIAKRRAALFEPAPGSRLDKLLALVLDRQTRGEAAEAGAAAGRVWRAVRGPDGHWRPAPSELGGFGPATDASFRSVKAIREFWNLNSKAVPLFIIDQPEGTRAFAWINGALVEALRN